MKKLVYLFAVLIGVNSYAQEGIEIPMYLQLDIAVKDSKSGKTPILGDIEKPTIVSLKRGSCANCEIIEGEWEAEKEIDPGTKFWTKISFSKVTGQDKEVRYYIDIWTKNEKGRPRIETRMTSKKSFQDFQDIARYFNAVEKGDKIYMPVLRIENLF